MASAAPGSLEELAAFVAVVDHGSFKAAAVATSVSAPVLSRRIRTLEERLKTELLQRTTRNLNLTVPGQQFYEKVRDIPSLALAAEEEIIGTQGETQGDLRLVLSSYVAHLPQVKLLLTQFVTSHPKVRLTIEVVSRPTPSTQEVYDLIVTGKLPRAHFPDRSVTQKKIFELEGAIFAAPSYIETHGIPKHPSELQAHNCLSYLNRDWTFYELDGEPFSVTVRGNFTSNDDGLLKSATISGLGITYAFPEFFSKAETQGKVQRILEPFTKKARVEIFAVLPVRAHVPQAVRLLLKNFEQIKANSTSS